MYRIFWFLGNSHRTPLFHQFAKWHFVARARPSGWRPKGIHFHWRCNMAKKKAAAWWPTSGPAPKVAAAGGGATQTVKMDSETGEMVHICIAGRRRRHGRQNAPRWRWRWRQRFILELGQLVDCGGLRGSPGGVGNQIWNAITDRLNFMERKYTYFSKPGSAVADGNRCQFWEM